MTLSLTTSTSLLQHSYRGREEGKDIKPAANSLVTTSLLVWRVDRDAWKEEPMSQPQLDQPYRYGGDLWFSRPGSARGVDRSTQSSAEQSAYQVTSREHRSNRSASPSRFPQLPVISTSTTINSKPLPPSPDNQKKRKPITFRSLVRRTPPEEEDLAYLHTEPYQYHQRSRTSSSNGLLAPVFDSSYPPPLQTSRSMPSSPRGFPDSVNEPPIIRAHSSTGYRSQSPQHTAYQPSQHFQQTRPKPPQPLQERPFYQEPQRRQHSQQQQQRPSHQQPPQQQRLISMETFLEPQPPRTRRTFDNSSPTSATSRGIHDDRQRPHTWLSPTDGNDALDDASELRLFVEATGGLPTGTLDFGTVSPNSPPHLQGSLFARTRQNDSIPLPLQHSSSFIPTAPPLRVQPLEDRWQQAPSSGYTDVSSLVPRYAPNTTTNQTQMPTQFVDSVSSVVSPLVPMTTFSSSALPRRGSYQDSGPSNMHTINHELERLGVAAEDNPDDELPNYAQSQAEMSAKRRAEASQRAKELESRWASARSGY